MYKNEGTSYEKNLSETVHPVTTYPADDQPACYARLRT